MDAKPEIKTNPIWTQKEANIHIKLGAQNDLKFDKKGKHEKESNTVGKA